MFSLDCIDLCAEFLVYVCKQSEANILLKDILKFLLYLIFRLVLILVLYSPSEKVLDSITLYNKCTKQSYFLVYFCCYFYTRNRAVVSDGNLVEL